MPSVFPASQLPAYGCHVMQLKNNSKNRFLQFPTIFSIEENCGVVEITFPTKKTYIGACDAKPRLRMVKKAPE
jgi:hypothetical protein